MEHKQKINVFIIVIIFAVLTLLNGMFINPNVIKVRKETYKDQSVNQDLNNLTVLFFSDVYFGSNITETKFDKLIEKINLMDADIVLFGGDLVSPNHEISEEDKSYLSASLKSITANYGKYAVLGDYDNLDTNTKTIHSILSDANFEILDNNNAKVKVKDSYLNIVGVNNLINANPNIETSFKDIKPEDFTIMITHTSDIAKSLESNSPKILLAGHSLGGSVYIPFLTNQILNDGSRIYAHGSHKLNNILIDTSNGITSPYNFRLFADPEIVIYKLKTTEAIVKEDIEDVKPEVDKTEDEDNKPVQDDETEDNTQDESIDDETEDDTLEDEDNSSDYE